MESPLVSVVVITYNSSEYILECLESIRNQGYKDIELIISDDCSRDNTVDICKKWLSETKERFVRTELITVERNTGTSANINRGIKASSGQWIKSIAGDDCLLPNCIKDNVEFVNQNKYVNILFSIVKPIGNVEEGMKWPFLNPKPFFNSFTPRQFRILLCTRNFLPAASVFMRKQVWENLGGYNEDIPLLEDWPMWMKATNMGYNLSFMDKETAEYRFSNTSLSHFSSSKNEVYLKNYAKATYIGEQYFRRICISSRILSYTNLMRDKNCFYKLLYLANVLNPFFWEKRNVHKKYNMIIR